MPRLASFMNISLDGCYADARGDMSFFHQNDAEAKAFMRENARGEGTLIFGRITYELMQSYWPTPHARANDPEVAERMTRMPKLVFSRTLKKADWQNTRIVKTAPATEISRLLAAGETNLTTLGSASIVNALAAANLIEEYQLLINPIILGNGKRLFAGLEQSPALELAETRAFSNSTVYLKYRART